MTSASNERQVKARIEQMKRDRVTDKAVILHLMAYPDGRRWLWLRLSEAQIFIGDEDLDPYRMAFSKGIRNSGLKLLKDITSFAPAEYIIMTEENTSTTLRLTPSEDTQDE